MEKNIKKKQQRLQVGSLLRILLVSREERSREGVGPARSGLQLCAMEVSPYRHDMGVQWGGGWEVGGGWGGSCTTRSLF